MRPDSLVVDWQDFFLYLQVFERCKILKWGLGPLNAVASRSSKPMLNVQ